MLLAYKNQSIDLQSKSIDWFLYEGNTGICWVKNLLVSLKALAVQNAFVAKMEIGYMECNCHPDN